MNVHFLHELMFNRYIAILMLALTGAGTLSAATYYVSTSGNDSNSGSSSSPWLTVSKAISVATSAGDIVNIASGSYSGSLTFNRSGSSGNPITFIGSNTVIVGNITISANYVTVGGLTCSPTSAGGYNAISLGGANNMLTNVTVTAYGASASSQATAIGISGSYNLIVNCAVRDLNDIDAFHLFGHNNTILGCVVTNLNQVNYSLNHTDFIQTWGGVGGSYSNTIQNCLLVNSTCQTGNTETDGDTNVHDWLFLNDVFANVRNPFFCGIPGTRFYNCVFYRAAQSSGSGDQPVVFYGISNYSSANSEMVNCVFLQCGSNPGNAAMGGIGANGTTLSTLRIEHNYFAGTGYAAKSGAYIGTSAVNGGNPYFVGEANYNFHLTSNSTILIGAATNLYSAFTTDKDGNQRPATGAWDIGAYRYGVISSNLPPTVSAISVNASDIDPNTAGLQIYGGSVVQLSATATDALTYKWSYTVNGGLPVTYQSGSGAVAAASFTYDTNAIGNTYVWTLTVSNSQGSAQSQLTLSVVAPPVVLAGLTFAAETGVLAAPFATASTVVGGAVINYIYQPTQTSVVADGGSASYYFTITEAGDYAIQALVNAPNGAANSFYVNIDAQPQDPTMIWDVTLTSGFEQRIISWRGTGTDVANQFVPKFFNLTAGLHQVIFRGREAGTQLSSFSLLKRPPQWNAVLHPVM
ncbi:MAG: choice-of-anchor Q domain-containing protein [Verrucomicrobiales bacterium]|nr:choice-of-anchor Q domain-containing protein [Verrucomicrobiales bacterium]